ncbi:DUF3021 family protein [Eubacteriales bacterium OttesenSCG-928-M02]|nr:DUF3021 family protein [Eubacteriales bacterium OttesenSCG-928-M02]
MNEKKWTNSGFARLFLWTVKAKYTMGIFYVVFVLLYLLFGLISEGPVVMLDLFTAIQMVFACFFIGILQQAILPVEKLSRPRGILWVVSGVVVTLLFSLGFGWFAQFPVWCFVLFVAFMALGMAAMIIGYYLELHKETKRLNRSLERFQNQSRKTEG